MTRQALVVVANPAAESFSHAMAKVAAEVVRARGYALTWHDLSPGSPRCATW